MVVDVILAAILVMLGYLVAPIFYPLLAGGACCTPTPRRAAAALHMADLKKDEVFYDLGCGTGKALMEASRSCDHVIGVEIDLLRWPVARLRARKARVILGDLFKQDISTPMWCS